MRGLVRAVIEFVVGDDLWIVAAVLLLLVAAAVLVLPIGVPAALWLSLQRAQRRAQTPIRKPPL